MAILKTFALGKHPLTLCPKLNCDRLQHPAGYCIRNAEAILHPQRESDRRCIDRHHEGK
ncbi:hypothetical protein [Planktothricoides raciborskii]|uniref:Uncharacterized protein n=2 Tax=Planktothricoides raciborskii TaxID=132608 RepID=A0AAU8J703_9CYAN|nr:hypothetical protein [Planktothricoides raciborskii]MBD2544957.1 hypothetical protein [Planktothricoides raciborskii FACHB-1370]MBD2584740.1 hypothetical protein [Planktothricoides raciborskii FACHB-1261]